MSTTLSFAMTKLLLASSAALSLAFSLGCVIDSTDAPPRVQQTGSDPTQEPPPPPDPNFVDPAVVEIEPDRTMTAEGGEGVGVFVEYSTGGKWYVYWTCDTALSGQPCQFLLRMTATDGVLTVGDEDARAFEFESLTRTEINEAHFQAKPGADVQIEAIIGGERDARFFFFVQNGTIKGGYTGVLTNPLIFRPKGGK